MAAIPVPGARRSLIGKAASAIAAKRAARGARGGALAAFAARAREHVVTVAALASVDLGAFEAHRVAGWVTLGVSLLVADFAIRG